jgi:hypothetical protein
MNKNEMLVQDQSTGDIIDAICTAHKRHAQEYSRISSFFNAGTPREVGRKIFNFLKNNVRYVIEPGSKQTVKSPAAIIASITAYLLGEYYKAWEYLLRTGLLVTEITISNRSTFL